MKEKKGQFENSILKDAHPCFILIYCATEQPAV